MKLKVTVNGVAYDVEVEVEDETPTLASIGVGSTAYTGPTPTAPVTSKMPASSASAVVAPLAGTVAKVLVVDGDEIAAGQVLVVLEAMKMETEITAPHSGTVHEVLVSVGDPVQGGQALIEL